MHKIVICVVGFITLLGNCHYVHCSCNLSVPNRAVLKVIKNGVEYMIKDGWGDIKMKSQVPNVQQVKSFLGEECHIACGTIIFCFSFSRNLCSIQDGKIFSQEY